MAISCRDAQRGAVVARINLSWLLAYDACDILLGEVSIHLMGRVRG